jgi:MoaA/NifB/PqqE/SkfB family radical SAM enzyme
VTAVGLLPDFDGEGTGQFLTFVVPAPGGCNLKCSFCLVRQRREAAGDCLQPEDLVRFIREAAERSPIFALAIQGYEPLLPPSLPYTRAVLEAGQSLGVPTTLVTNGVLLREAVDLLATLMPSKIAISLDSDSADIHDRVRGVAGAWTATVAGIKRAVDVLAPRTKVAVSSVLLPSKRHHLEGMPARLQEAGVEEWIVNPLLRFGREEVNGPVGERRSLFRSLLGLKEAADRAAICLKVDDEFDRLDYRSACARHPELGSLEVRTLPTAIDIFRLVPSGRCSVGEDIMRPVTPDLPQWRPGTSHAGDFLETLGGQSRGFRRRLTAAAHKSLVHHVRRPLDGDANPRKTVRGRPAAGEMTFF